MELTKEQLQERILQAYRSQLSLDRNTMATYLIANGIVLECMDRLSEPNTPLKWIRQDTKAAYKTFEQKFTKNNKTNLEALFNIKSEDTIEGEILIDTQDQVLNILNVIGRILGSMPVQCYPQVVERLLTMEIMPVEMVNELQKEIEE